MGRRRRDPNSPKAKRRAAAQKKKWDNMTANQLEDMMGSDTGRMELYGYGGRGGKFKNEAEAKQYMRDLRSKEATASTQSAIGDMVKQYTGQDLPAPPQQGAAPMSPKAGGAPKGQQAMADPYQTGAPRGSYMDRVRRKRAMQGVPGFGQYGPAGRPNPYAANIDAVINRHPNLSGLPPRRRTYNPATGLME